MGMEIIKIQSLDNQISYWTMENDYTNMFEVMRSRKMDCQIRKFVC